MLNTMSFMYMNTYKYTNKCTYTHPTVWVQYAEDSDVYIYKYIHTYILIHMYLCKYIFTQTHTQTVRVQEAEDSAAILAGVLEDLDAAKISLARLEPLELEKLRALAESKKEVDDFNEAKTRVFEAAVKDVRRRYMFVCVGVYVWIHV